MEETNEKNHPSLPPNYVSLADLQQRWMKQQEENKREKHKSEPQQQQIGVKKQQEKRREKEKHETQKPNLHAQGQIGGDDVNKQQEKRREKEKCETQKPQQQQIGAKKPQEKRREKKEKHETQKPNLHPQGQIGEGGVKKQQEERREKEKCETQKPNQGEIGVGVKQQQEKRREKEQCEPQNPSLFPRDRIGGKDVKPLVTNSNPNRKPFGRNGDRKGRMEYRLVKSNPQPKPLMIEAPQIDGGDQVHNNQVDGEEKGKVESKIKKKNKNKKKKKNPVPEERNPGINGKCGSEERENEAKGGGEAPLKPAMGDRTVEIEAKLKKLSVDGGSNGRSTAVIEGSRWPYRAYGRVEHRGMWELRRENGLKWVKKGEVLEHNAMK